MIMGVQMFSIAACLCFTCFAIGQSAQSDQVKTKPVKTTQSEITRQSQDLEKLAKMIRELRNEIERKNNGTIDK